ncbi:MAG: class II glutamine amidotransferase [Eubacterium sp.]|nr:class II glutamine amidotransferase [Eubacterium sp.]
MCELFGVCARKPFVINDYLKEFYSHCDMHPDGWGLAVMHEDVALIEKEPIRADRSHYLRERLTVPIDVRVAFAHIRYATIGNLEYANCHPHFRVDNSGRKWTLIHNGTIFEYPALNRYFKLQRGTSDSERILMHIISLMDEAGEGREKPLTFEERFAILDEMVGTMSRGNKLNLMLYDGEYVYVHTNCEEGGLHYRKNSGQIIISTQALEKEGWNVMPANILYAYKDGTRQKVGTDHGNTYVYDPEAMKVIFQTFSNL